MKVLQCDIKTTPRNEAKIKLLEENLMNQTSDKELLESLIQLKRKEMYVVAYSLGYTHPSVVSCSQDLDILINQYQDIEYAS